MKKLTGTLLAVCLALATYPASWQEVKKVELPERHSTKWQAVALKQTKALPRAQKAVSDADFSLYEGRTFHANLVNSDAWDGASITNVPYGIYSYTLGSEEGFKAISTDLTYNFMASAYGRDEVVGVFPMSFMGILNGVRYLGLGAPDFKTSWEMLYENASYGYIPKLGDIRQSKPTVQYLGGLAE